MGATKEGERIITDGKILHSRYGQLIQGVDENELTRFIKVLADGTICTGTSEYALMLDDYSIANITYVGKAAIGSTPDESVWQIKRIDETTGMVLKWADGNDNFDNVWDNRTSYTYE